MKLKRAKVLRPVVIVPLVVVLASGAVWLGLRSGGAASNGAASATQQLFTVSPTTLNETVSASGTIAATDTEDLSFTVAGTVATVNVKAGQVVTKGQVLATLDSATLSSSVASAKATLDAAQATLSDDESAGASSAQITNDQAAVTAAYANLISANSGLSGATLTAPIAGTVATMNLTVGEVLSSSGATGTNLSGTGTGSGRTAASTSSSSSATGGGGASSATSSTSSATSSSSTAQIEVVSSTYVVNLSVDTTTVGNLKDGQSATVTPTSSSSNSSNSAGGGGRAGGGAFPGGGFGGFGGAGATGGSQSATNGAAGSASSPTATAASATGKVTSVSTIASTSSGVATFPVVISVSGTPTGFHIGGSASAVITYRQLGNVLAVPANAVTQANGVSTVTVSTNGTTAPQVVTTGISTGGQIQISSGLTAGDQVVVTIPQRSTTAGGTSGNGGSSQFPGGGTRGGVTG